MKSQIAVPLLRTGILAVVFSFTPGLSSAGERSAVDRAVQLLALRGALPIQAAGPYVERGTARVQVAAKLGSPDAVLPDGTWLYHDRGIEGSAARGTLAVRFDHQRVISLELATRTTVAAWRAKAEESSRDRLATK